MASPIPTNDIAAELNALRAELASVREVVRDHQALFDNATMALLITVDRKMVRYNAAFARLFGFVDDSGIGLPARVLYPSDEAYAEVGRIAGPALSSGKPVELALEMQHQDGHRLWVRLIGYLRDSTAPAHGTYWILDDRTAAHHAELALHQSHARLAESEARLTTILGVLPGGVLVVDADGRIERANARAEEIFGYTADALVGQPVELLMPERFHGTHPAHRRAFAAEGTARAMGRRGDLTARHRDGHELTVEIGLAPMHDDDGLRIILAINDVTARRRAEHQLEMAFAVAQLGLLKWQTDADTVYLDGDRAAPLGYPRGFIDGGRRLDQFVHPADLPALTAARDTHLAGGPPVDLELRVRKFNDAFDWVRLRAVREDAHSPRLLGIFHNVATRKEAEEKFAAVIQRLNVLQAALPDTLLLLDTSGIIREASIGGQPLAAASVDAWPGRHHAKVFDAALSAAIDEATVMAFDNTAPQHAACTAPNAAGDLRRIMVTISQMGTNRGFPEGFLALLRDEGAASPRL